MENKIPLPTDNIYKFYALFGLSLFIFSCGALIYVCTSTNDLVFQVHPELAALQQIEKPTATDLAKRADLEKRIIIAGENKDFFNNAIGVIGTLGFGLMLVGFWAWQTKVQPIQDEIAKLQLKKLRHEVSQLKQSSESHSGDATQSGVK